MSTGCLGACRNPRASCYKFREDGLYRRHVLRHVYLPYCCDTILKIQWSLSKDKSAVESGNTRRFLSIECWGFRSWKMILDQYLWVLISTRFTRLPDPRWLPTGCDGDGCVITVPLGNLCVIVTEAVLGHIIHGRTHLVTLLNASKQQ